MGYIVGIICDGPDCKEDFGFWENFTITKATATRWARDAGWQVGKKGWFCPKCRRTRKGGSELAKKHSESPGDT